MNKPTNADVDLIHIYREMLRRSKNTLVSGPKANVSSYQYENEEGNSGQLPVQRAGLTQVYRFQTQCQGTFNEKMLKTSKTSPMCIFALSTLFFWWFLIFFRTISLWKLLVSHPGCCCWPQPSPHSFLQQDRSPHDSAQMIFLSPFRPKETRALSK